MASEPLPPPGGPQPQQARITPGLIVSILPPARLAEVAGQLNTPVPLLAAMESSAPDPTAQRMLAQLNDVELRRLAAIVGAATDGQFVDLYRRLSRMC